MSDPYYDKLIRLFKKIPPYTLWEHIELAVICAVLERHNGNRSEAARDLDLSVRTIRNKIVLAKEYGFSPPESSRSNVGRPRAGN